MGNKGVYVSFRREQNQHIPWVLSFCLEWQTKRQGTTSRFPEKACLCTYPQRVDLDGESGGVRHYLRRQRGVKGCRKGTSRCTKWRQRLFIVENFWVDAGWNVRLMCTSKWPAEHMDVNVKYRLIAHAQKEYGCTSTVLANIRQLLLWIATRAIEFSLPFSRFFMPA